MNATDTSPTEVIAEIQARWLLGKQEKAYVLVDAAVDYEPVFQLREQFGWSPQSLFEGDEALALADVAPYLCPVQLNDDFLSAWCQRWSGNHGVLLASAVEFEVLMQHLRSIFAGVEESGEEYYFRFYDPRVLREHVDALEPPARAALFGPVGSWCLAGEAGEVLVLRDVSSSDD